MAAQEAQKRHDRSLLQHPLLKEPPEPPAPEVLYLMAATLEGEGKAREAVQMYAKAARAGSGKAARRLAEIYDKGLPGVAPDRKDMLMWRNVARTLGEEMPPQR